MQYTAVQVQVESYIHTHDSNTLMGRPTKKVVRSGPPHPPPLRKSRVYQAYVERVFSVCGDLRARKRNPACVNLERRVFLKVNRHQARINSNYWNVDD